MVPLKILYRYSSNIGPQALICFVSGVVFGFFLAILFTLSASSPLHLTHSARNAADDEVSDVHLNATSHNLSSYSHLDDSNNSIAEALDKEIRIFCLVMTQPKNNQTHVQHIQRTWGRRCNKILFMSTLSNITNQGPVPLPVTGRLVYKWAQTKAALRNIYNNNINDADWFLKTDDETYMIMENLRYMLYPYSSKEPLYFGRLFKMYRESRYKPGTGAYVLSKKALQLFVEKALNDPVLCDVAHIAVEGEELNTCMDNVGIKSVETNDWEGRAMFLHFPHINLFYAIRPQYWYWQHIFYELAQGFDCCSDNAVSFHFVEPIHMYVLEFVTYHLHPYGISYKDRPLPAKKSVMEDRKP